ncbi:MAG: hypothetical protein JOZ27_09810, partial [Caulobacteraceae bacterium]|nr:hypothetical protein [Caulobacteraceae bacterium]
MSLADSTQRDGHAPSGLARPAARAFDRLARAPSMTVRMRGKTATLATDRVRAAPAVSPTLAMNIGMTAIALGAWGLLFPRHVKKTLGIGAPAPVVQAVFGVRELVTGYALAGDPTKAGMLWARVAGDAFDIVVLNRLDRRSNPHRGAARAALGFVLAVTV